VALTFSASVAKRQGTRLQSADRGFDSRTMLDGSVDGSDSGLLNLKTGFDSLTSNAFEVVVGCGFESRRGHGMSCSRLRTWT
jgi:hypothetical protein